MTSRNKIKKQKLITQYGSYCYWCGCESSPEKLTVDHLIPRSRGGSHSMENLRVACLRCNHTRGNSLYPPGWQPVHPV